MAHDWYRSVSPITGPMIRNKIRIVILIEVRNKFPSKKKRDVTNIIPKDLENNKHNEKQDGHFFCLFMNIGFVATCHSQIFHEKSSKFRSSWLKKWNAKL